MFSRASHHRAAFLAARQLSNKVGGTQTRLSPRFFLLVSGIVMSSVLFIPTFTVASDVGTRVWSLLVSSTISNDDVYERPYLQRAVVGGVENGNYHAFWMVANKSNDVQNRIYWRPYNNSGAVAASKLVVGAPTIPGGAIYGPTTLPAADDTGGVYFSYASSDGSLNPTKSYVQNLRADGTNAWASAWASPALPGRVRSDPFHYIMSMKRHPNGGVVILYRLENSLTGAGSGHDLYAQYINASGVSQWGTYGKRVSSGQYPMPSYSEYRYGTFINDDEVGDFVVVWKNYTQILVQRLDDNGNTAWGSPTLVADRAGASFPSAVKNADGSLIFTWTDTHLDFGGHPSGGVYAQKISTNGAPVWGASGITVSTNGGVGESEKFATAVQDEEGGAIIVWQSHGGVRDGEGYMYAQRLDRLGAKKWAAGGIEINPRSPGAGIDDNQSGSFELTYNTVSHRAFLLYPMHTSNLWFMTSIDLTGHLWASKLTVCSTACDSLSLFNSSDLLALARDTTGGALAMVVHDYIDEGLTIARFGAAIGPPPPVPPPSSVNCSSETVGHTVDIFSATVPGIAGNEYILVGGDWGWKLIQMRSPNTVYRSGTDHTASVHATYVAAGPLAAGAKTFAVGGKDGWKGFSLEQAGIPQIFSSPLVAYVVDTYVDGTMFAAGPNGWEVRSKTGVLLRSGTENVRTGGLSRENNTTPKIYVAGSWGWKIYHLDGTVDDSGTDNILVMQDYDGVSTDDAFVYGGTWGYKVYGTSFTRTTPIRAADRMREGIVDWAYVGGDSGLYRVQPSTSTVQHPTTDPVIAVDGMDYDTSSGTIQGSVYGGPNGWGRFSYTGLFTKIDNREVWAVANTHNTGSNPVYMIGGGSWGWEVITDSGTISGSGPDPVNVCLDFGGPKSIGNFTVYDGVLQIRNNSDTLELGNAGRDIASTGAIYLNPFFSPTALSFFTVDNESGTQRLVLDAASSGVNALTARAANDANSAFYAEQNATGLAGSFFGDVLVSGVTTVGGVVTIGGVVTVGGSKNAKLQTSRGDTYFHAIESPDVRFEDFGRASTRHGRATITLDPTFLETVTGDYTVELTAEGKLAKLAVTEQTAKTFTVTSDIDTGFSYRVSALRKGYAEQRFSLTPPQP